MFAPDFPLGYEIMDDSRPFPFLCLLHGEHFESLRVLAALLRCCQARLALVDNQNYSSLKGVSSVRALSRCSQWHCGSCWPCVGAIMSTVIGNHGCAAISPFTARRSCCEKPRLWSPQQVRWHALLSLASPLS